MRAWLLQSRQSGLTCGHLHEHEAEAWRCLGMQADPASWTVMSLWLSSVGAPPKRNTWAIAAGLCLLVPLTAGIVAGLVNMLHGLWMGTLTTASVGALVVLFLGVIMCLVEGLVINATRRPSSSGLSGWEWSQGKGRVEKGDPRPSWRVMRAVQEARSRRRLPTEGAKTA